MNRGGKRVRRVPDFQHARVTLSLDFPFNNSMWLTYLSTEGSYKYYHCLYILTGCPEIDDHFDTCIFSLWGPWMKNPKHRIHPTGRVNPAFWNCAIGVRRSKILTKSNFRPAVDAKRFQSFYLLQFLYANTLFSSQVIYCVCSLLEPVMPIGLNVLSRVKSAKLLVGHFTRWLDFLKHRAYHGMTTNHNSWI